ncbi:MAG: MoaD/ThiS family protein [Micavibrio aeruginosavorus]|uniref:MoaD/ThiS family protein n=1 Tax=Micavibrio aeruginosavorus TaxID=349221 RepID=A0A7T5UIB9_9BACT|nr:MAG: MoaD/ThiS family protein [Micavibrio aeruginosavorus]
MKQVTVNVRLYGGFRKYKDSVDLSIPAGTPVSAVKESLCQALGPQSRDLIMDSVVANDQTILPQGYVIEGDMRLSILPPVCGG